MKLQGPIGSASHVPGSQSASFWGGSEPGFDGLPRFFFAEGTDAVWLGNESASWTPPHLESFLKLDLETRA